jgi:hypothetical protein
MNLNQISTRIADPASCLGQEIPALKELTEKYPYSQIFSILYLKALSNHNDFGFEDALQKHAYRISDRMKLYYLIHGDSVNQQGSIEEAVETVIEKVHEAEILPQVAEVEIEEKPVVETPPAVEIEEAEVEEVVRLSNELETIEEIVEEEPKVEPTENNEIVIESEIEPELEIESIKDVCEKEIPTEKINPSSDLNAQDEELNLEIISQVVANVYNENLENSVPEQKKIEIEEKISEQIETEISTIEKADFIEKRSFTSWLKMGEQPTQTSVPEEKKITEEEIEVIEKQIDKIINKFIEKEPSISRPQKEFYSPSKKAKESVNPDSLIYTETLANIFAIQGNFPKAIVAYEQLMLTNPEKKIFFANRIEELKEKLK